MIQLEVEDILALQRMIIDQSGGSHGVLDPGKIESAVAQPKMTFGGIELYPSLSEKAAAIGYSSTCNHGFIDGNKRIGHAAMELLLVLNGHEIVCGIDEQEALFLQLATGQLSREVFTEWVMAHSQPKKTPPEKDSHGA